MKQLWKIFCNLCKLGTLVLCALLIVQALPLSALPAGAEVPHEEEETAPVGATPAETALHAINTARLAKGLLPLSAFPALSRAAELRAAELAATFSHTRPNGAAGFSVLDEQDILYTTAAENLAAGYHDGSALVAAFLTSDSHRQNLYGNYRHVGIGYHAESGSFAVLFLGGCETHTISVSTPETPLTQGKSLADANLTLTATCAPHGKGTLLLTDALCAGFEKDTVGVQTIPVLYGNASATLTVQVGELPPAPKPTFTDVPSGAWYADAVYLLADKGILSGTDTHTFSPTGTVTRVMLVTMLGRMAGINPADYTGSVFKDVPADAWYAPYVAWAYENGIATGYGGGVFSPNSTITREQLCVFLVRYAGATKTALPTGGGTDFADAASISSWAQHAVSLVAGARLISGYTDGSFRPQDAARRAETAATLAGLLALQD